MDAGPESWSPQSTRSAEVLAGWEVKSQLLLPILMDAPDEYPAPVLVCALAAVTDAVVDAAGGNGGGVVAVEERAASVHRPAARVGRGFVRPIRAVTEVIVHPSLIV